jgi:hypothetical protein
VPQAVEYDAGDIPLRVKSVGGKHRGHLLADLAFIVAKSSAEHFRAAAIPLFLGREPWIGIKNLQGENDGRVRTYCGIGDTGQRLLADFQVTAEAFKPATSAHSHLVKKTPVAERHIGHHARGTVKLRVCLAVGFRQVSDDVFGGPAAPGYDRRPSLDAVKFACFEIDDTDELGLIRRFLVLNGDHGRGETKPGGGLRGIERGEVDGVAGDSLDGVRAIDPRGDQALQQQSRNGCVSAWEHLVRLAGWVW